MMKRRTPLRSRSRLRRWRSEGRQGPLRNAAYLAWVRSLRCVVCQASSGRSHQVEAAHTNVLGPKAMGRKTSDFSAIPLCFWHHQGNPDSYHRLGEKAFAARHGLDLTVVVHTLNELYHNIIARSSTAASHLRLI
ncbi:MAG: DUF968 domain-containing protein [Acidobacteriales bacterium]|nr:DUF968 domain-containing protein [Terriglobales bacterium]